MGLRQVRFLITLWISVSYHSPASCTAAQTQMATLQNAISVAKSYPFLLLSPKFKRYHFTKLMDDIERRNRTRGCSEDDMHQMSRLSEEFVACFETGFNPQIIVDFILRKASAVVKRKRSLLVEYYGMRWEEIDGWNIIDFNIKRLWDSVWRVPFLVQLHGTA